MYIYIHHTQVTLPLDTDTTATTTGGSAPELFAEQAWAGNYYSLLLLSNGTGSAGRLYAVGYHFGATFITGERTEEPTEVEWPASYDTPVIVDAACG